MLYRNADVLKNTSDWTHRDFTKFKMEVVTLKEAEWILCPVCGNKTRDRIREDTVLKNYPLYCPKCKQETLIEAINLQITVITEPDAQPQSR